MIMWQLVYQRHTSRDTDASLTDRGKKAMIVQEYDDIILSQMTIHQPLELPIIGEA